MFAATYDANFTPISLRDFAPGRFVCTLQYPSQVTPILILWVTVLTFGSFSESVDFQWVGKITQKMIWGTTSKTWLWDFCNRTLSEDVGKSHKRKNPE
jgi:hypothetical protein